MVDLGMRKRTPHLSHSFIDAIVGAVLGLVAGTLYVIVAAVVLFIVWWGQLINISTADHYAFQYVLMLFVLSLFITLIFSSILGAGLRILKPKLTRFRIALLLIFWLVGVPITVAVADGFSYGLYQQDRQAVEADMNRPTPTLSSSQQAYPGILIYASDLDRSNNIVLDFGKATRTSIPAIQGFVSFDGSQDAIVQNGVLEIRQRETGKVNGRYVIPKLYPYSVTWNRDGQSILYEDLTDYYFYSLDVATGNPQRLTIHSSFATDLAVNGTHLVYSVSSSDTVSGLALVDLACSQTCTPTQITSGEDLYAQWNPDGTKIAFVRRQFGICWSIHIVDSNGKNEHSIDPGTPCHDDSVIWSPDGNYIAFSRLDHGEDFSPNIYIAESDGTNIKQLTTEGAHPVAWIK
jgi:hypothetical protein